MSSSNASGGIGSGSMPYNSYGQSMTQQGLPGTGGFPIGTQSSQTSELSSSGASGGGSGGGGGSSVGPSMAVSPPGSGAPTTVNSQAPIGAPPAQPTQQNIGRNKCHQAHIDVFHLCNEPI